MFIHSRLWWRLARWRVRSRMAYAAKYIKAKRSRPVGPHEVLMLGLGGFVVDFQRIRYRHRKPADEPITKVHGKYDERLIRAYSAAMGHYLANQADEPAPGHRK